MHIFALYRINRENPSAKETRQDIVRKNIAYESW